MWQPTQLFMLNRGPRPLETVSVALNRASDAAK
jgi:hypothetical protein